MLDSQYIKSIELLKEKIENQEEYPFCLDAVKNLSKLNFHPKVTFLVGENGTGKSTLLEAIAVHYGFNPEGGSKNFAFSTRNTHSDLDKYIRLAKGFRQPKDGYFLRAESYYNVATNIDVLDEEPSFGPLIKDSYGGKSLHEQSHGESFFSLFLHRFFGNGIYILDEPEAALSPQRQLAFLVRLHELVKKNSQFIIATHSPIFLSYPNAKIIEITKKGFIESSYKETEHYSLYKSFLNNPEYMLEKMEIIEKIRNS